MRYGMAKLILGMLCLCIGMPACEKPAKPVQNLHREQIVVMGEQMALHNGDVGIGTFRTKATYLLVDAKNQSAQDLGVTLGGDFLDGNGNTVDTIDRQSLRIPAGEVRTFALIGNKKGASELDIQSATVEVTSTIVLSYDEPIRVTDVNVYPDGNRVVVKGYVQNIVDRVGNAVVIATFYDRNDRPMKRPSTLFELARHARRGVQFVGPEGSVRGTLFVGAIDY